MEKCNIIEEPIQSINCSSVNLDQNIQKMIEENINFVYSTVNKNFFKYITNDDIREDLYQAGKFGLSYAANKFDHTRHTKFITYAVHWIKYYVYQEVLNYYQIPLNQNHIYKRNKINKVRTKFIEENGKEPTIDDLGKLIPEFSKKVIKNVLSINDGNNYNFISFQSVPVDGSSDSENSDLSNLLNHEIAEQYTNPELKYQVKETLSILKQRVEPHLYDMFVSYYINGNNYSDIALQNGLKFPASAKYYVNKVREEFKNIYQS